MPPSPSRDRIVTTPLRVCIATCDIVGPIRNGGIGTAYYSLALALARAGHHVTVLYALGTFCESRTIDHWRDAYAAQGIEFVPLPATNLQGHSALKMSYAAYVWLKARRFDVVHFHEWRGLGFYTTLAKRQGLCLPDAVICVGAHSPVLWHLEGMNELADADTLEVDFMERESVARADVLWSPSAHMLAWMRREGWTLPRRLVRKPYILLDLEPATARRAGPGPELVFFGRLETRKGLDLFCDALDRLAARGEAPPAVTFLGKVASVGGVPSDTYVTTRAARWPFTWRIESALDRDGAMAYLRAGNRVGVLPSRIDNLPYTVLECLGQRIPFVAAATGGIPEMIAPADRARVLFDPTAGALADRLATVLRDGLAPARLRVGASRTLAGWLAWHRQIAPRDALPNAQAQRSPLTTRDDSVRCSVPAPLVSVCLTHHNRPELLETALESIRRQDYAPIEVILVDDGSDRRDAMRYLETLEPEFRRRGWTLLRQPNRYLGAARNAAIAAARGTYVLFMDDDNVAVPHEVRTFVRAAECTGADILTCLLDVFQSARADQEASTVHLWPFLGGAVGPGLLRNVFGDANALFRRDVFDRIGGFTEDVGIGCEDWELFARAVLRGLRLEVVPEPLVRYRQAPGSMLHSTPAHANRMRALRPYLGLLPARLRPLVHLARQERAATGQKAARLDHVRRAVVFGSGEAGRLAIGLADRCGWSVPWIVDNNPATWNSTAHGLPVRAPDSLTRDEVDLVIVASLAGKSAIAAQLERMGLAPGSDFVHFLDPVRVGGTVTQVHL
jgi:glycosyltransferase involved in cell wall biosynthesis/GT2 family glycosyltransferase